MEWAVGLGANKMIWINRLPWFWFAFGGLLRLTFFIAILALVVVAIVALIRNARQPARSSISSGQIAGAQASSPAFEILKERYAKGEITKEQYDQMRNDLMG
jgi:putative membrane protein